MRIKKSEYRKALEDKYWEGVQAGMKVGINNPAMAKKYVDNIPALRYQIERIAKPIINNIKAVLGYE